MQLIQDLINSKSTRICTRSPSGFVLEIISESDPSGQRVVAASPVDQNLCQYFVVTELPGQGSYTIANTAATGTFLEPTSPTSSAPLRLIASSGRFDDENQEWNLIFEENANGWLVHWVFSPGCSDKDDYLISITGIITRLKVFDIQGMCWFWTRRVSNSISEGSIQPSIGIGHLFQRVVRLTLFVTTIKTMRTVI